MAKLPYFVQPVSRVAATVGGIQAVTWIVLGSLAMRSFNSCSFSSTFYSEDQIFSSVLHRYFFLHDGCPNYKSLGDVTISSDHVFIWAATSVALASVWVLISIWLFFYVTDDNIGNVNIALFAWSIVTLIVSGVDIALGTLFGLSFGTICSMMVDYEVGDGPSLYEIDLVRLNSLLLMLTALRGVVLLILNLVLSALLFYFTFEVNKALDRNEHAIHSMGPIHGYNSPKHQRDLWPSTNSDYDRTYERPQGGQANQAYSNEAEVARLPPRTPEPKEDSYGRSFDRSDSWNHGRAMNQRPFSYLEEPQFARQPARAVTAPVPAPAPVPPPWKRREPWNNVSPPVPAPDYSPPNSRRLKSALKSPHY